MKSYSQTLRDVVQIGQGNLAYTPPRAWPFGQMIWSLQKEINWMPRRNKVHRSFIWEWQRMCFNLLRHAFIKHFPKSGFPQDGFPLGPFRLIHCCACLQVRFADGLLIEDVLSSKVSLANIIFFRNVLYHLCRSFTIPSWTYTSCDHPAHGIRMFQCLTKLSRVNFSKQTRSIFSTCYWRFLPLRPLCMLRYTEEGAAACESLNVPSTHYLRFVTCHPLWDK